MLKTSSFFLLILLLLQWLCMIMMMMAMIVRPSPITSERLGRKSSSLDVMRRYGNKLQGKTAIITGGNSGIGIETCKALANEGVKVILCCRDKVSGERAKSTIEKKENIVVKELDLESLISIKSFASDIIHGDMKNLDFLVLNAGVMAIPKFESTDAGFEKQIGINHVGHFYLCAELQKLWINTSDCRIISVASSAHSMANDDWLSDLDYKKTIYTPWEAYGRSKRANIHFAKSLQQKINIMNSTSSVRAVSLHPGVIKTPLWRYTPAKDGIFSWALGSLLANKTPSQGAATTLYAISSPRISLPDMQGVYLDDCSPKVPSIKHSRDGEKLWTWTSKRLKEALVEQGISIPESPLFFPENYYDRGQTL